MTETLDQVLEIVYEINSIIYEAIQTEESFVDFLSNGEQVVIDFLGGSIWDSENDNRELIEEANDHEPLKPFLVRKIQERVALIAQIVFPADVVNGNSILDGETGGSIKDEESLEPILDSGV